MLSTHVMATPTTQSEVRAVPIPERDDVSARWRGISHDELLTEIFGAAHDRGLVPTRDEWSLAHEGNTLFGSIDFKTPDEIIMPKGVGLSFGLRHSNVSEFALTFVVGGRVFVCDNGVITGEFLVKRKHTIGVELPEMISNGMDQYLNQAKNIAARIEGLKASQCDDGMACQYVIQAGRLGVMPWSQLDKVMGNWFTPPHEEFQDRNKWSLYNAFTEVSRERRPDLQMAEITKVGSILNTAPDPALLN